MEEGPAVADEAEGREVADAGKAAEDEVVDVEAVPVTAGTLLTRDGQNHVSYKAQRSQFFVHGWQKYLGYTHL